MQQKSEEVGRLERSSEDEEAINQPRKQTLEVMPIEVPQLKKLIIAPNTIIKSSLDAETNGSSKLIRVQSDYDFAPP